jgi:hypothetical protein
LTNLLFVFSAKTQVVDINTIKQVALNAFYNYSSDQSKNEIVISELIPVKDST